MIFWEHVWVKKKNQYKFYLHLVTLGIQEKIVQNVLENIQNQESGMTFKIIVRGKVSVALMAGYVVWVRQNNNKVRQKTINWTCFVTKFIILQYSSIWNFYQIRCTS